MLTAAELQARIATLNSPMPAELDVWNTGANPPLGFTYQFAGASQPADLSAVFSGWAAMSADQMAAFRSALAAISQVANIAFTEVTGSADPDFNFGMANIGANTGIGGFSTSFTNSGGVITRIWDGFTVIGNGTAVTWPGDAHLLLHEICHSLGMKHPGNYDIFGNLPPPPFLDAAEDNNKYSLMSYNGIPGSGVLSNTLMVYDIAALQARWGANMTFRTGNDTYTGGVGGQIQAIWDAGGLDLVSGAAQAGAVTISLRNGEFSTIGAADNLIIAYGATIENASGGGGGDRLIGNDASNQLLGNGGNDTSTGGKGGDRIYGGIGNDWIDGGGDNDTWLAGDAGLDTVYGGLGNDRIDGGADSDIWLSGDAGADTVTGNLGNDRIDGGADNDVWLAGDAGSDTVTGGLGNDRVDGGADNDAWLSGDAGIDLVTGGLGNDRIDGGADGDTLYGNEDADTITGGLGTDYIYGGAGIDYLEGGGANDQMTGGAQADTFDVNPGTGLDSVYDFINDVDTVRIDPGFGFASVAAVLARTIQSGNHARILLNTAGTDSVYLLNYLGPGSGNTIANLGDDVIIG